MNELERQRLHYIVECIHRGEQPEGVELTEAHRQYIARIAEQRKPL